MRRGIDEFENKHPKRILTRNRSSICVEIPGSRVRESFLQVNFEFPMLSSDSCASSPAMTPTTVEHVPPTMQPVHERPDFRYLIASGVVLTCVSGLINAFTILQTGTPVTHATGSTSQLAINSIQEHYSTALQKLSILVSFLIGSVVSATAVGSDKFVLGHKYGYVLLAVGVVVYVASSLLNNEDYNWISVCLFAFASGLQNAMCTSLSGAVIRTTHTTGMLTDIGMSIGYVIRDTLISDGSSKDSWKLRLLIPQYLSYLFGGCLGTLAFINKFHSVISITGTLIILSGVSYIIAASRGSFDGFLEEEKILKEVATAERRFTVALHNALLDNSPKGGIRSSSFSIRK